MNLTKTQEFLLGLESFCKYIDSLKEQFDKMKYEIINRIDELIKFLNIQTENINKEKQKHEIRLNKKQYSRVAYNANQFNEQFQNKLTTISNYIKEKISSIQTSDDQYIRSYKQCFEESMNGSLILKDDSEIQKDFCFAIAFNQSGTIMASGCGNKIKVWHFNNGKIKEITILDMQVLTLTFSKKNNNFLSGSKNQINMWQTKNDKSWQNVNQSGIAAYCMILNSKETQLYTGGYQSICVWDINFEKEKLLLLCELNMSVQKVYSLTLNEDEQFLAASCADKSILVWVIQQKIIELYQTIKTKQRGYNLCFINNTQFIWLSAEQNQQNGIQVYDIQNGEFQEKEEKIIHLLQNDTCCDSQFFPIVLNQERNIIAVRHKLTVYLLQVLSNGNFKIVNQKQFETNEIYGTMTNDGTALVLWDSYNMKYSIYEIDQ